MDVAALIVGLVGALIGAAGALFGQFLSNSHQRRLAHDEWSRERAERHLRQVRSLYAGALASFEKCIRATTRLGDYDAVLADLPRLNARLQLMAPEGVVSLSERASEALHEWSSEFRRGAPKKIESLDVAIVSSTDLKHADNAKRLYGAVNDSVVALSKAMKLHLESLDPANAE